MKTSFTRALLATTVSSAMILTSVIAHASEKTAPEPATPAAATASTQSAAAPLEGGKSKREGKRKHGKKAEFIIKKMDSDADGKVSKKEYDAFQNTRFKETDANNDGAITLEEIEVHEGKERAERRALREKEKLEQMKSGELPPPPPHGEAHDAPPPPPPADAEKPKDQPKH